MPLRRIREVGDLAASGFRQGFRRLGPGILELVEAKQMPPGPAALLGARRRPPRSRLASQPSRERRGGGAEAAVQPGRQIVTLKRAAGLGQPVAFMSPDRRSRATVRRRATSEPVRRPELDRGFTYSGRAAIKGRNRPRSALRWRRPVSALDHFSPTTRQWFADAFAEPTPAQAQAWPAIASGEHVLITAPTGSGKTLAAFLYGIDRLGDRVPRAASRRSASSTSRR